MVNYYRFVRKTRRFSLIVLMNACLLPFIYWACQVYFLNDEVNVFVIAAVVLVEIALVCVAIYLWKLNEQVEIRISPNEFYYYDPLFGGKALTVAVNEIIALEQIRSATNGTSRNLLRLKDGSVHELMYQNFNVDRRAMFDALKKANSRIELPEGVWAYTTIRPQWAKHARKKIGLDN